MGAGGRLIGAEGTLQRAALSKDNLPAEGVRSNECQMIRLSYARAGSAKHVLTSEGGTIAIGREVGNDIRFDGAGSEWVGARHAVLLFEKGAYRLRALDRVHTVWLNGQQVREAELKAGDSIRLGIRAGPEIRVLEVGPLAAAARGAAARAPVKGGAAAPNVARASSGPPASLSGPSAPSAPWLDEVEPTKVMPSAPRLPVDRRSEPHDEAVTEAVELTAPHGLLPDESPPVPPKVAPQEAPQASRKSGRSQAGGSPGTPPPVPEEALAYATGTQPDHFPPPLPGVVKLPGGAGTLGEGSHEEVQAWMAQVAREVSKARAKVNGRSSGKTMVIMASALAGLRESADVQARRSRRILRGVLLASALVMAGLSGVIWFQQKRIGGMVAEKVALDGQIEALQSQMSAESDEEKLAELEARLEALMGKASDKVLEVRKASARRAEELARPADPLEDEIRKILRSFGAETYAIPPVFKQALQEQLDTLRNSGNLSQAFARKRKYWPAIQKALRSQKLPEELGYIAFAESGFDPKAQNPRSHASGMWQLMEEVAKGCGLSVDPEADERFDALRSSEGAACYLSRLLVEFGQESFMLALASYNRGENGVRRALHKVAREPGGYRRRDFWHLYRLKLLPPETRDYVPRVLAAAIVLGNPDKYGLLARATPSEHPR